MPATPPGAIAVEIRGVPSPPEVWGPEVLRASARRLRGFCDGENHLTEPGGRWSAQIATAPLTKFRFPQNLFPVTFHAQCTRNKLL